MLFFANKCKCYNIPLVLPRARVCIYMIVICCFLVPRLPRLPEGGWQTGQTGHQKTAYHNQYKNGGWNMWEMMNISSGIFRIGPPKKLLRIMRSRSPPL